MESGGKSGHLPLLLVSAADSTAATTLINEITKDSLLKQIENNNEKQYLWTIRNKYYEVTVVICMHADGTLGDSQSPEAHIIFVQDTKGEGVEQAETRAGAAQGGTEGVRLMVCEASPAPTPLAAWARARRYELVELGECAPTDIDDDELLPDQYGVERVIAALHAHVWPGLCRVDGGRDCVPGLADNDDQEEQLERAEEFAELLGRLGAARAAAGDRDLSDTERRAHAECLVAAFCQALGLASDNL